MVSARPWSRVSREAEMKKSWTNGTASVTFFQKFMPSSFFVFRKVLCLGLVSVTPMVMMAQAGFVPDGGEYLISGPVAGDQVKPALGLNSGGGYVVWEDNITDGSAQGISARRVDASLSGSFSSFRVNVGGAESQQKPQVVVFNNGGAVFVWQGGPSQAQQIYARFLSSSNTWITGDVLVNTFTNSHHLDAGVAKLSGGDVVMVWSSFDQDGSYQGVYGQRFSPQGAKLGGEFQIPQTSLLSQRTPVVAGLSDGGFVVAWISETQTSDVSYDVSVYARRFDAAGVALTGEVRLSTGTNVCANPSVASSDAGFCVAWGEKDVSVKNNSWDIYQRTLANDLTGGTVRRVNTQLYGDQLGPKVACLGGKYLVVWTSMAQDGSFEGVYGQFLNGNGTLAGGEFRVNTSTAGPQLYPAVSGDNGNRFLVVWSSFAGGVSSFDLFAQRYVDESEPLTAPAPPFVTVLSSNTLSVTWPEVGGFNVANYQVYVNGASQPSVTVTSNWWTLTGLTPASTHYFRLAYVLTDGRTSPLSGATTNTTYSAGATWGGIPQEWMREFFGDDIFQWPAPNLDSDGDGVSNRNEFLAGTIPTDADSVLRTRLEPSSQGMFLQWNTQPGLMYQVQVSTDLSSWTNSGGPRFAPGLEDSLYLGANGGGYYRIVRLR